MNDNGSHDTPWKVRIGLLVLFVVALTLCIVESAQGAVVPGQAQSQVLAQQTWQPACGSVKIVKIDLSQDPPDAAKHVLGRALGNCTVGLNWPMIKTIADDRFSSYDAHETRVINHRAERIWSCSVIVHEYGHEAQYRDPIGVPQLDPLGHIVYNTDGTPAWDYLHSPDPHNIMTPVLAYTYPPCRQLFPLPKIRGTLRPDAYTSSSLPAFSL